MLVHGCASPNILAAVLLATLHCTRDVGAAMEGRTDPIVCIGYEETATVKYVSFQPNSTLLVSEGARDAACIG